MHVVPQIKHIIISIVELSFVHLIQPVLAEITVFTEFYDEYLENISENMVGKYAKTRLHLNCYFLSAFNHESIQLSRSHRRKNC